MKPLDPYMQKNLVVLNRNQTIEQAAMALCRNEVGCVLVGDEQGCAVGILTDRDLVCRGFIGRGEQNSLIGQVMSYPLVSVRENESLKEVIALMIECSSRRIPIIQLDSKGQPRFSGLVTLDELILTDQINELEVKQILRAQFSSRILLRDQLRQWHQKQSIERLESRHQLKLNHFYQHLREYTHLSADLLPSVVFTILSALWMRVSPQCAQNFSAQLPQVLRQKLEALPSGPNREYTGKKLITDLSLHYQMSSEEACATFAQVLQGLSDLLGSGPLVHLSAELPREFQPFFHWPVRREKKLGRGRL